VVPDFEGMSAQRPNFAVRSTNRSPVKFHQLQCRCSTLHCAADSATNMWNFADL